MRCGAFLAGESSGMCARGWLEGMNREGEKDAKEDTKGKAVSRRARRHRGIGAGEVDGIRANRCSSVSVSWDEIGMGC